MARVTRRLQPVRDGSSGVSSAALFRAEMQDPGAVDELPLLPMPSSLEADFAHEPVPLRTFIEDRAFLRNPALSPVQFEAVRHLEQIYNPDTHDMLFRELGSEWEPVRYINFATICWGKGCQAAGEEVYDARTGDWVPVEDVVPGHVASVADDRTVRRSKASESWVAGEGQILRISTSHGQVNRVYTGHRYLTPQGWKQAGELSVGDQIASVNSLPEPLETESLPSHEVELVAWWLGDGVMPKDAKRGSVVMLFADHEVVAQAAYHDALSVLGVDVTVSKARRTDGSGLKSCVYVRGKVIPKGKKKNSGAPIGRPRNPMNVLVEKYGLEGTTAFTKRVPAEFFRLPTDQVRLFLSRIWGTDGHIYMGSGAPEVSYCTVSEGLAKDLQRLLLRIGCLAHVDWRKTASGRGAYVVRMRDMGTVARFCREVRLLDKGVTQDEVLRRVGAARASSARRYFMDGDTQWVRIKSIEPDGYEPYYDLEVPGDQNYVSAGGLVGHNSGKDSICRIALARIIYLLQCLRSPQEYFGMPPQDYIHTLNVASSSTQAHRAFFTPFKKMVENSPWFKTRSDIKEFSIAFDKQLEAVSGHSMAETMEGLNLIAAIADEISAFKTKDEVERFSRTAGGREPVKAAETIYRMLRTSARTRFPRNFKLMAISYPRFQNDAILRLLETGVADNEARGDTSRIYVSGPHATWDVNPRVSSREDFQEDYDEDPVMARTMYECKPEASSNRFFRNDESLSSGFLAKVGEPPLQIRYTWGRDVELYGPSQAVDPDRAAGDGWQVDFTLSPDLHPMAGAMYALHGDLSLNADAAGIAMCHVRTWHRGYAYGGETGDFAVMLPKPIVKVDFVTKFVPDLKALSPSGEASPREIQVRWFRKLVYFLLAKGFNVGSVTLDNWQSVDTIQILQAHGLEAKRYSLDRDTSGYTSLRDVLYDGRLEGYDHPELLGELVGLTRLPNGRVDHPPGGSKDLSDALAGAVVGALLVGGDEGDTPTRTDSSGGARFDFSLPISSGMDELGFGPGLLRWDSDQHMSWS